MEIKDRIRRYWDDRSATYDSSLGHSGLENDWKEVLSGIFHGKKRILDIGTGTGFLAILLAELGHEVVGIDLSEGMLSVAREKAGKAGVGIDLKIADAENLPFDDESFDAIICRHVLWTLPNPEKAVREWSRIVRNGGKVVVIDGSWYGSGVKRTFGRFLLAIYEKKNPFRPVGYDGNINRHLPLRKQVTPQKVAGLMESAGLGNISVTDLAWIRERLIADRPFFYRLAWDGRSYFLVEGLKGV